MYFLFKIHPKIAVPLLFVLITIQLIGRFFSSSIWGIFYFLILLYGFLRFFTNYKPFLPHELLLFVSGLNPDYKVAILSSTITVIGFVIAFKTSEENFKKESLIKIRLSTAQEIEGFFSETSHLVNELRFCADRIINLDVEYKAHGVTVDTNINARVFLQNRDKYQAAQNKLSFLSSDIYRLAAKNTVLASLWGGTVALDKSAKAFNEITNKMWFLIPDGDPADPRLAEKITKFVQADKCQEFISISNENMQFIMSVTGALRGVLTGPVMGFGLVQFFNLIQNKKQIREMVEMLYTKDRKIK